MYSVRMLPVAQPNSDPQSGLFTLAVDKKKLALSHRPTEGYIIDVFWSPGERYVAVDNRRANSGDYVWVFSLPRGSVIKAPDESCGDAAVDRALEAFPGLQAEDFAKCWNFATGWQGPMELEIRTKLVFFGRNEATIARTATYRVEGGRLIRRKEQFDREQK